MTAKKIIPMLTFLINFNSIQHAVAQDSLIPNSQEQNAEQSSNWYDFLSYVISGAKPVEPQILHFIPDQSVQDVIDMNDHDQINIEENDIWPVPSVAQTPKLEFFLKSSDTYDFLASCSHNSIDQKINDIATNRLFDSNDNGPYIQTSVAQHSNTDTQSSNILYSGVVGYQKAVSQRLHLGAQINIMNSSDADNMQSYLASFYGVWFGDKVTFTNKIHFGQVKFSQDNTNNWICLLASSLGYTFKLDEHILTPALEGSYYTTSDEAIDLHNVSIKVIANYKYLSQLNEKNDIKIIPGILAGLEFENQYTDRGKTNFIFAPNLLIRKNNMHLNLFYQLKKSKSFITNSCFVALKINI